MSMPTDTHFVCAFTGRVQFTLHRNVTGGCAAPHSSSPAFCRDDDRTCFVGKKSRVASPAAQTSQDAQHQP